MLERIKEAVTETFGEKCADFDANCHGCQAWAEIERLDCPPLSGQPAVTDMKQLLEQGDRAHAALCRELRIQTSLVGDLTAALRRAISDAPAREQLLQNVEPDDGCWVSCSGCHETNEGYETGHYAYSPVFKCYVGCGCRECGGLGVIWDNTDYSAMGDYLAEELDAPAREVTVREAAQVLLSACPNPIFDDLKPVLIGEFSERIEVKNEDGDDESVDIPVSWTVTKEIIFAALRALSQGGEG